MPQIEFRFEDSKSSLMSYKILNMFQSSKWLLNPPNLWTGLKHSQYAEIYRTNTQNQLKARRNGAPLIY